MGNILFRRKKIITEELQKLHERHQLLEEQIRNNISSKHSIQCFSTLVLLACMTVSIGISLFRARDSAQCILYSLISFFAGMVVLYSTRFITEKFFNWCIQKKRDACYEIVKKKHEILERVKETETFKVAKEILDEFGESAYHPPASSNMSKINPANEVTSVQHISSSDSAPYRFNSSLNQLRKRNAQNNKVDAPANAQSIDSKTEVVNPMKMPPRPFVRQSRSVIEKFVDFVFGDGPNNRYALICSHCYEHNGMSREEEFDYMSYRCWVCGEFNPARRQRRSIFVPHIERKNSNQSRDSLGKSRFNVADVIDTNCAKDSLVEKLENDIPTSGEEKMLNSHGGDSHEEEIS